MPQKIVTEDGTEMEVPTEEELTALKTSATKADELEKMVMDLKAEKEKYDADPVQKNWNALRTKTERMEKELAAQGKKVGEDGSITDAPKGITAEEIEERARNAARSEIVGHQKNALFSKFDDEKRKLVEHYFNKLTTGENVSTDNIEKFVQEAELLADPQAVATRRTPYVSGGAPILKKQGGDFSDTEVGASIADEIFGNESFTKTKK